MPTSSSTCIVRSKPPCTCTRARRAGRRSNRSRDIWGQAAYCSAPTRAASHSTKSHTQLWNDVRALLGEGTPLAAPNVALTVEHRGQRDVSYEFAEQDADAIVDYLTYRGVIEGEARELPPLNHPATPLAGSEQFIAPASGVVVYRAAGRRASEGGRSGLRYRRSDHRRSDHADYARTTASSICAGRFAL